MRCGWMRPSSTSRSRVSRATSRRTGSKQDSSTASGVSSMIRLTPVTDSKARMFRPSRPMIRPFISSPGRCSTETTDSLVCSVATRWIASETTLRARFSPSDRAWCSMSRTIRTASRLAWFSIVPTSSDLAWMAVRPATRSRVAVRWASSWSMSAARSLSSRWRWSSSAERSSSRCSSLSSRCSRSASRFSRRSRSLRSSRISSLTARICSSASRRPWSAWPAASSALDLSAVASVSARVRISSASRRAAARLSAVAAAAAAASAGVRAAVPGAAAGAVAVAVLGSASVRADGSGAEAALWTTLSSAVPAGAFSVPVPDLRQTTTSANTAARSPIAMNTKEIPPFTVTPSAHQAPGYRAPQVRYQGICPGARGSARRRGQP